MFLLCNIVEVLFISAIKAELIMKIYPPFTLPHIFYLLFSIALIVGGCFFLYSQKINKPIKTLVVRIIGVVMCLAVLTKQISVVIEHANLGESNAWVYIFPNSYCSFSAFVLGIFVAINKTDSVPVHFLAYNAIIGCTPSVIYPDYLYSKPFFAYGTIGSLTFHLLAVFTVIAIRIIGDFKPNYKRFYWFPIGFIIMVAFGFLLVYGFGSNDAMNITKPLISDIKLSYWYTLFPLCTLVAGLMVWVLSKIKPFKEEMITKK